ncbi:YaiI/YqxD family protein [Thermoanaerobacterium sp. RBIITD]|uniref:YaiI/YqxD family protein n=1 Tax=Thermoanaerobacterium sp. RBIITD TaxID=1550240 RepID=UPI000BB79376|nr:YaiI/YqxD family protein [Thermoanaerobacterium sp. RBIITD]SNX53285.1 hypothetical protein SAMN05660242_0804 [Thermoanaerobacterium sp. RBIITD]
MKILVDADACPVKDIIVKVAKEYNLPVIMFIDTTHILDDGYSEIIVVDKGFNSVDIALINKAARGDIIVTQDFGVATMALARGSYALNQNGLIFSNKNMDRLLFEKHISQKIRRSGGRTSNPKKRTKENDEKFEASLRKIIETHLK